jgi:predicted PurR-regulated permease PerM
MVSRDTAEIVADSSRTVVVVEPMTPTRAMKITLAVLFVVGLVWLFIQVAEIVLLLVFGILLAAAVDPIVNRMRRHGLSRGQSILLIYGVIFLAIAGGLILVVPLLVNQGQVLVAGVPEYLTRLREFAATSSIPIVRQLGTDVLANLDTIVQRFIEDPPIQAAQITQALDVLTSFVGIVFTTVASMIVAYYWMTEKAIIKRLILGLFPLDRRDRAHLLWDNIEHKLGGWARGQVVLMLIIGIGSTIVYAILGLPFWFLLGIFAGLTEVIPIIGPFLGGGLAFLVALGDSWQKAIVVLIFVVILQQIEGNVIVPRVMRNAVGLTPLSVLLAVLVGTALLGPLGAILAIPFAAAVQVLVSELLRTREEENDEAQRPLIGRSSRGPAVHPEPTSGPSPRPVAMTATEVEVGARRDGGGAARP